MNDPTPIRMTVDEFLSWAPAQGGRWELIDGRPIKMPSETFDHIDVKAYVWLALKEACAASPADLHVLSDGATVRIDQFTAYEPDALVYSGAKRPGKTIELSDPLIVVEVVSPNSWQRDRVRKRADYFTLASVEHYLVVDPEPRAVVHFTRDTWHGDGRLLSVSDSIDLSPPGLHLPTRRCFEFR